MDFVVRFKLLCYFAGYDSCSADYKCHIFEVFYSFQLLPPTKEVNVFARVCLSVCLLARLLKNACMDLDEMLHVDRCRDMDELINF